MADINLDVAVQAGLKATKVLRSCVRDLFRTLSEGSATVSATNGNVDTVDGNEKTFVNDLQTAVTNINNKIRELESACTLFGHHSVQVNVSLGNTALIGQDPAWERTNIYTSMISTYRCSDRLTEHASHASAILHQNSLKRASSSPIGPGRARIVRRNPVYTVPQVDNICIHLQRLFADMKIEILRPFNAPAVLKITLDRVLKAVVLLRGAVIEWVLIKGFHEDFIGEDGKIDIWSESRYQVFRKVTDHANAAMLHFYSPVHSDLALRSFVVSSLLGLTIDAHSRSSSFYSLELIR